MYFYRLTLPDLSLPFSAALLDVLLLDVPLLDAPLLDVLLLDVLLLDVPLLDPLDDPSLRAMGGITANFEQCFEVFGVFNERLSSCFCSRFRNS